MDFSVAISIDSVKGDFYHNRGFALKKKNLLEEAILDFTECIRLEKNHFKAYYNRANCYEKLSDFELAK
jgi:tetratricopeptide (TPR) repeat protein